MSEVVGKLWGFCNTLRHDGIGYGDYIEQLTYLLFLKIAQEKGVKLPHGCTWNDLKVKSGTELLDAYIEILRSLSKQKGMLGDIFAGSLSKFREPVNLKKLITLIDETQWSTIDVDVKAEAYEGLLQKYAEEEKGAGQYFTPREAIRCVVRCISPDIRERPDFTIHDPAVGTAGFLIGAYEWMMKQTKEGAQLTREERDRLQTKTFSGCEIVIDTKRLALMNLYLHEIEADIYYGDALAEGPHTSKRYNVVMTNPPFGTKGAGQAPVREDFTVKTANKQLNFVQHVIGILKPGGRASMVVPDNVLFEETAGKEVRKLLMEDCNLHTILRLPIGTFTPYSPGVKANIIFFTRGEPTKEVWIYDNRTSVEKVAIRHPLTADYFKDFEICYHANPRKENERFRKFTRPEIAKRDDNLDISWLKEESRQGEDQLEEPEEVVGDAVAEIQTALDALNEIALMLAEANHEKQGIVK
jgi:type I restriction enzyme M protein